MKNIDDLKFDKENLITVVTQDEESKKVLMVAYAKKEQILKTLQTGMATYYSRSRQCEWIKGETSGHYQQVKEVAVDCDGDAILYIVHQKEAACHTNEFSCFYRRMNKKGEFENERK